MRGALLVALLLVACSLGLVIAGASAAPLSRSCSGALPDEACEAAVDAVLRRGMPSLHPLILAAHVEPGSAPGSEQTGHRATVEFDLLGVPGTISIELYFDRGAHWGGESDRADGEIVAWALAPLALALIVAVALLGLARRRRDRSGS
jgi:hypothetical protein